MLWLLSILAVSEFYPGSKTEQTTTETAKVYLWETETKSTIEIQIGSVLRPIQPGQIRIEWSRFSCNLSDAKTWQIAPETNSTKTRCTFWATGWSVCDRPLCKFWPAAPSITIQMANGRSVTPSAPLRKRKHAPSFQGSGARLCKQARDAAMEVEQAKEDSELNFMRLRSMTCLDATTVLVWCSSPARETRHEVKSRQRVWICPHDVGDRFVTAEEGHVNLEGRLLCSKLCILVQTTIPSRTHILAFDVR
jgi:hypothetical protein